VANLLTDKNDITFSGTKNSASTQCLKNKVA